MFQKKDKAKLYRFGNSLRETIIEGCAKETRLRKVFEAIFLQKTGIQLLYSDLDFDITPTQPTLFLGFDKSKNLLRLLNLGCELHDGVFYPRGLFCQSILDMLNEAFQVCKLPTIEFDPNMSIIITDYCLEAPSVYFNVNIVEIDRAAREAFPNVKFTVRWRYMLPSFCYLILEDDAELKAAEQSGAVEKIIAFISAYCKTRDPLHIFDEIEIRPEVVSKSRLDKNEIIAILRDHTGFTSC